MGESQSSSQLDPIYFTEKRELNEETGVERGKGRNRGSFVRPLTSFFFLLVPVLLPVFLLDFLSGCYRACFVGSPLSLSTYNSSFNPCCLQPTLHNFLGYSPLIDSSELRSPDTGCRQIQLFSPRPHSFDHYCLVFPPSSIVNRSTSHLISFFRHQIYLG